MNGWQATWLVATREMRERFRARSFRISTLLAAAVVAAIIVVPSLRDETKTYDVGLVGTIDPVISASIRASSASLGAKVELREVESVQRARQRLREGSLDVALVNGREILVNKPLDRSRISGRVRLVGVISEAARLQTALTDVGLTSQQAAAVLSKPALPVRALGKPEPDATDQVSTFIGVLATMFFLLQYGAWILVGVAEEKSSRIAEVLLAALRPRQLVGGKVLGISLVGLTQAVLVALTAFVASRSVGTEVLRGADAFGLLAAVGWFVLGIAFYGWAYAAAGSLVARQSDAQAAGAPITIPMYAGYVASTFTLSGGDVSPVVKVLAFFPPTTPFCMPTLIANNAVEPWQIALSVVMLAVAAFGMARIAGSIYSNSILRTGKRIKWTEALRSA